MCICCICGTAGVAVTCKKSIIPLFIHLCLLLPCVAVLNYKFLTILAFWSVWGGMHSIKICFYHVLQRTLAKANENQAQKIINLPLFILVYINNGSQRPEGLANDYQSEHNYNKMAPWLVSELLLSSPKIKNVNNYFWDICDSGRRFILDVVIWRVQSPTVNTCKNPGFHFHVYKLAFGFFPHGKPVAAAAEETQQLLNLSTYTSLVLPTHGS